MALDEFGREIQGSRSRREGSPGYESPSRGEGPSSLYAPLASSRYSTNEHERHEGGSGWKRKHRDESPPTHRGRSSPTSRSTPDKRKGKTHPSSLYAEEPMLCQILWKEANPDKSDEEYGEYQQNYCLNYIRTFFNEHLDDSWFRSLYSPLEQYRVALQEHKRAAQEATGFGKELASSMETNAGSSGPCFFVLKARLGGGTKLLAPSSNDNNHNYSRNTAKITNPVPASHVLASTSQVLKIQDVPCHVTEEQLLTALKAHCGGADLELYSSSSSPKAASGLTQTCFVKCTDKVRKDLLHNLHHLPHPKDAQHVPRKEDTYLPKTLHLQVECSDAYGRTEIDADGKGGGPEDKVRARRATVSISTLPLSEKNVQVLTMALSTKARIAGDCQVARELARAYDARRKIPEDCRLEVLLAKALPNLQESTPSDVEDALDMSIAYLRRVHLFCFYNGCTAASNVAQVWMGQNPTSTIHLRLENADELLAQTKEQAGPVASNDNAVDLLVQRLDQSIEKAVKLTESWESSDNAAVVSAEIDSQAKDIEKQESEVEGRWIQDHSLIDEDGRARCSFHFCRKLFKDNHFLKKHLMKKHSEFLKAEQAKCHDSYMMKSWDAQEHRPVPPIMVECGRAFGLVPSPVIGMKPLAVDPEPELWSREEERRKRQEEEQEARRERYEQQQQQNSSFGNPRPPREFVDVDDMKEEKVEMAFDAVEIPVEPPKKKKKKRKLL